MLPALTRMTPHLSMPTSPKVQGTLLAVAAFAASAAGQVLAKQVYALGAQPSSFLLIRLVAAVSLLAVISRSRLLAIPTRRRWTLLGIGVAFGVQTLAYFSALELAPVALVVVVVTAYPLVVIVQDSVATRTVPSPARIVLMVVSLGGLWLAAGRPAGLPDLGVGLALVSAVGYGTYLRLSARALTDVRPIVATCWVLSGALVTISIVTALQQPTWPTAPGVVLAILHGAVATTIPIVAIYAAISRMSAGEVSALGPLEPILATGLAAVVLGEALSGDQLLGGALVVGCVAALAGLRPRFGLPRLPFALPRNATPPALRPPP
jgi:drug/metabolite transporter (DMT)-like permease